MYRKCGPQASEGRTRCLPGLNCSRSGLGTDRTPGLRWRRTRGAGDRFCASQARAADLKIAVIACRGRTLYLIRRTNEKGNEAMPYRVATRPLNGRHIQIEAVAQR